MAAQVQKVLVVEDEASIASFVSLYLTNAGYLVQTVGSGRAARPQARSG
jgi:DNA-binding response OmpR family regulator